MFWGVSRAHENGSATARLRKTDSVPALDWHFHRLAQREPHLAFWHAGGQRLVTRTVAELVDDKVSQQRPAVLFSELSGHGPSEFARTHRDSIKRLARIRSVARSLLACSSAVAAARTAARTNA